MTTETGGASARIKHVVVLMLENRSFDQMLGLLPGVNGVSVRDGADSGVRQLPRPAASAPRGCVPGGGGAVLRHPRGRHPAAAAD